MGDQSRRVRADWTIYEAAGRDLEARAQTIGLERDELAAQIEPLELAVESGCLEYKRQALNTAFRAIEDARYRSVSSAQIAAVARQFGLYAYVTTVQRLMADGTIQIRDRQPEESVVAEPEPEIDVKKILAEIQERVKEDPALRTRQPVKNILMQLSRYTRELEQFKELTARTPAEKRGGIAENFRRTTEEIFSSIRRNYEQVQREERAAPVQPRHILLRIPIKPLAGLYLKQARAAMEVRSGLLYAREEQQGTREMLLALSDRHEPMLAMVDEEATSYLELSGTKELAHQMARAFARELAKRIERETEVY